MVRLNPIYRYWLPPFLKRLQRHESPPPPKTALAALFFLGLGTTLIAVGLCEKWYDVGPKNDGHFFALWMLGFLTFLPGSYASFMLWGAFRGWPYYSYDEVPSWDDNISYT